jgi:CheY-like chemotaxis protein
MKVKKLCIIDDDDLYKLLLKKSVKNLGNNVDILTYSNGEEAFNELSKYKDSPELLPDLILLDINMPVMDGWEFMDKFVAVNKHFKKSITIFIASSSIAQIDLDKSKSYDEISGYIVKPILKETVAKLLISQKAV